MTDRRVAGAARRTRRRVRALRDRRDRLADRLRGRSRVHFLHVGKTGGTALKEALGRGGLTTATHRLIMHEHDFTMADVPAGDLAVFVVRDPVARFVSAFNSRLRQGRPRYDRPWSPEERVVFTTFPSPGHLADALADPDGHEFAATAMRAIEHVRSPLSSYVGTAEDVRTRASSILMVGWQEALAGSLQRLTTLLGAPQAVLPSGERAAHRSPAGMAVGLTPAGEEAIRSWYYEDYRLIDALRDIGFGADPVAAPSTT